MKRNISLTSICGFEYVNYIIQVEKKTFSHVLNYVHHWDFMNLVDRNLSSGNKHCIGEYPYVRQGIIQTLHPGQKKWLSARWKLEWKKINRWNMWKEDFYVYLFKSIFSGDGDSGDDDVERCYLWWWCVVREAIGMTFPFLSIFNIYFR